MNTNFDIYDVISYIVPGTIAFIISLKFLSDMDLSMGILSILENEKTGVSLIKVSFFLFVSYLLGQAIQMISLLLEKVFIKKKYSHILLEESEDLRKWIKKAVIQKFEFYDGFNVRNIVLLKCTNGEIPVIGKSDNNKIQQLFSLCHCYILQNNNAHKTAIYNRQYSFYRSLSTVAFLTAIISIIMLIFRDENIQLGDWLLILGLAITFLILFFRGYKRSSRIFVQSVYHNFLLTVINNPNKEN